MGSIPNEVVYSDGEAFEHADLNLQQRFAASLVRDGIVREMASRTDGSATTLAPLSGDYYGEVYCPGDGLAVLASATTRTVSFRDGLICIPKSGSPAIDGETPTWDVYWATAAEISDKQRDAAVTNPRWDILCVQLTEADGGSDARDFEDAVTRAKSSASTNKRKTITATFQWTQGTEAASPSEPAVPSGYSKICAVLVTPAMTTFDPFANELRDYRVPFGSDSEWGLPSATPYEEDTQTTTINHSATDGYLPVKNVDSPGAAGHHRAYFPCRHNSSRKRVVAFEMLANSAVVGTGSDNELTIYSGRANGSIVAHGGPTGMNSGGAIKTHAIAPDFPLWCNGFSAGVAAEAKSGLYEARPVYAMHEHGATVNEANFYSYRWIVKGNT